MIGRWPCCSRAGVVGQWLVGTTSESVRVPLIKNWTLVRGWWFWFNVRPIDVIGVDAYGRVSGPNESRAIFTRCG